MSAFSLLLPIITVSGVLEVKPKFSYKVLDRVTYSLCTFDSLTYNICGYFARPIVVWKNVSLCYTIE